MPATVFERYRSIIDDWDAFQASLIRPQPAALRVNRLKADPAALRARLEERGFRLEPYDWYPDLWRVAEEPFSPALTLEHWLGRFYLQEAAAAVPVLALDPQPGETVLDLSAAPGGKSTQMAERMGNRGMVVANDPDPRRLAALSHNLQRLGVTSAVITRADGRQFPGGLAFDRVLVDAPCSAEGNARRSARARQGVGRHQRRRLPAVQLALLRRALALVRPGGVVVYSTCTFAPEENEAVVDQVLRAAEGSVTVEPLPPALPGVAGVTAWEGQRFRPEVEACRRIYPHHLDSGGMFVARLRKRGPVPWEEPGAEGGGEGSRKASAARSGVPARPGTGWVEADAGLRQRVVAWLGEAFGLDESVLEGAYAYGNEDQGIWLAALPRVPGWEAVWSAGIRLVRGHGATWKPTSFGLMQWAAGATRNVVDLDRQELQALLEGRQISAPPEAPLVRRGWIVLRYRGHAVGCGFWDGQRLRSALPHERAGELLSILRREDEGR
ncbi:RNA methylase, NOL1/NOP2/sun family [Thermaerobacter marianensis DSM 12885]|uniref:RNA methylase, NOL1/NOP2/sun family n=1 Tax=Thermaerobacter marianensis (strain ATCC 700841 / DSM 12885 / JCM 10246 / 7p75a) TaxID=644966 RepID=E6SIR6_THEM7|nr:RsmB/NOP family class I SAM-dependent RNA methyltransferase [Thermaerobacter marianensis]ADU52010.1 RNA methylase, NOL1/NOP2/sun family [Thermaerobacter marianensis DSM 12885]